MGNRRKMVVVAFFICSALCAQQKALLRGTVLNSKDRTALEQVQVQTKESVAYTDKAGAFSLSVSAEQEIELLLLGGSIKDTVFTLLLYPNEVRTLELLVVKQLDEAVQEPRATLPNQMNEIQINYRGAFDRDLSSSNLAGITTDLAKQVDRVENVLTALPGVNSNSELSNQYSVRGGSFDENLIYVNGIEMYRPFLIRSGKQEGLSFINPTMVQDISFSAGGFKARYGDKMSSVLDITYRKPTQNKAYLQASFLGAGATVDVVSKDRALTAIIGMRYQNNRLLMNRKEDEGHYRPSFMDTQGVVNYQLDQQWSFSFIGNIAGNQYKYEPNRANVVFGGVNPASNVTILYKGKEEDKYSSLFGALVSTYQTEQNKIDVIFSAYHTQEKEYYDIEASYLVVDQQLGDSDPLFGSDLDQPLPIRKGVASQFSHARNNYDALAVSAEVKGTHQIKASHTSLLWGVKYVRENSKDRLSEWELMDSLGYVIPSKYQQGSLQSRHVVDLDRLLVFGEWNKNVYTDQATISLHAGARMQGWRMSEGNKTKMAVSPRAQIAIEPSNWESDMLFTLSMGLYQQPPSYREYRGFDGELNPNLKAQKAWVVVLGNNYRFNLWDKNFRMQSEVYYKKMDDVNSYTLNNVRMRYVANNEAKAYVYGADVRLYGEFIADTESWISIGYMKTEENYQNKGYIARPTDQRLKFGLLFQDYVPSIPNLKLYLNAVYNTGLPGGGPSYADPYLYQGRLRDYKRADIGFNYVFKDNKVGLNRSWLQGIDHLQIGVEIYNVFNVANAITNTWIRDLNSNMEYAIPNYMTNRTFNMKVSLTF